MNILESINILMEETDKDESFINRHKGKLAAAGAAGALGFGLHKMKEKQDRDRMMLSAAIPAAGLAGLTYAYRKEIKQAASDAGKKVSNTSKKAIFNAGRIAGIIDKLARAGYRVGKRT
jgi:hypothetical protein